MSRLIEEGCLGHLHGDDALVINCLALHEASRYGKSFRATGVTNNGFSDSHDLVLVPILFDNTSLAGSQPAVASIVGPLQESRKRCWESVRTGLEESRSTDASHWDSARAGSASTSIFSGTASLPTPSLTLELVPCKEKAVASGASRLEEEEEDALASGAIWDPSVELTRDDSSDTPSTKRRANHRLYDEHLVQLELGLGESLAEAEDRVPDGSVLGASWFPEEEGRRRRRSRRIFTP